MAELVQIEREGAVARMWLNRPDTHNALSDEILEAMVSATAALAGDEAVRVLVLGGRGPSFCAGADIGAMKASASATFEQNLAQAERFAACFAALSDFPKPVVGRIHGSVYGGGVGFTCVCDIAVASDDAKFGLTEVRLGILPAIISPYVIRRLGDRWAREFMLTGERFDAATAARIGLVHHTVPAAELDAKVEERVRALLQGGPQAQHRVKQLLQRWGDTPWSEYRRGVPRVLSEVRAGEEAKDGLDAFFEKRKAKWLE